MSIHGLVIPILLACVFFILSTRAQYFNPNLDDKTYLDNIQYKLELEKNATRVKLMEQVKITELVAKEFVAAQIKENLFIVSKKSYKILKSNVNLQNLFIGVKSRC